MQRALGSCVFHNRIDQCANPGDVDRDDIAVFESEFIGRNDAGAR